MAEKPTSADEKMLAMNEALTLAVLRQHELTEAADSANVQLRAEIAERKRAEEAVRESEARFRQLADAMPQIVWAARPDGYIDYYNERWYEFTGFSENYREESWKELLHPDDVERHVAEP